MRSYGRLPYVIWLALVIVPFFLAPVGAAKAQFIMMQDVQYKESVQKIEMALATGAGKDDIYIENKPFKVFIWGYTPDHFPGLAALFVLRYPENIVAGRRVFFIEESAEIRQIAQAQKDSRISGLLVSAPQEIR